MTRHDLLQIICAACIGLILCVWAKVNGGLL